MDFDSIQTWMKLLLCGEQATLEKDNNGYFAYIRCCESCFRDLEKDKLPAYTIINNLRQSISGDPLKDGVQKIIDQNVLSNNTRIEELPMCFELIESAFVNAECPLDGICTTTPEDSEVRTWKNLNNTVQPTVLSVSSQWKLNDKQHCAFVILCATLLRKHISNISDTMDNVMKYVLVVENTNIALNLKVNT